MAKEVAPPAVGGSPKATADRQVTHSTAATADQAAVAKGTPGVDMQANTRGVVRQYCAAAIAGIAVIMVGTALGWPSPILPQLERTGDPLRLSHEQISWMVSLLYVGQLLSPVPAGYLMDALGRKRTLLLLTTLPISGWLLTIWATTPAMLYGARFLHGTWSGIVATVLPMYLAEVSQPRQRGALSTFNQVGTNMGVLIEYVIGPYVSYRTLTLFTFSLPVLFLLSFLWMPESPYYQLMRGDRAAAGKSLAWLRGYQSANSVVEELDALEHGVQQEMRNKGTLKDLVRTRGNRKALLIVEVLAIGQRMSGISALMAYTSTTLPQGGALDPDTCVIIMGAVWVASVFIATVMVDSIGRKPLLLLSATGCGIAMAVAALWFYLDSNTTLDVSGISWLPFAGMLLYGVAFSIGMGPIASTVQGEAFPTNVKALASAITSILLALTSFFMNKIYHTIADRIGMYLNFCIFAASCLGILLFVTFFMVETKGKTLHEIQEQLNKSRKQKTTAF